MLDAISIGMQRTRGLAAVGLGHGPRGTVVETLRQEGSAKAFLPRTDGPDPEVVFLNTAGGLTGGDVMGFRLDLGAGGRTVATTQTAERVYRSAGGAARVSVEIAAGEGAMLDWLPQETILFDGAALDRETRIDLGRNTRLLMAETIVLGRAAMGETVRRLAFADRRIVRREGRPVLVEPLAFDDADLSAKGAAGLDGARALATLALFAEGAEDALGPVRAQLAEDGVRAHASAWDGKLIVRAMAADAQPLRRLVARIATHLGRGPLPRVWQL